MCMQDLAISARIQWRPCQSVTQTVGGRSKIAASPLRVGLMVYSNGGNADQPIRAFAESTGPIVNLTYGTNGGFPYYHGTIMDADVPGIFNSDLYSDVAPASMQCYEAVMDSDLSKAVQTVNQTISQRGG